MAKSFINPLKLDPSRTAMLRRQFADDFVARLDRLAARVGRFIGQRTHFEFTVIHPLLNARFEFATDAEKVYGFEQWMNDQIEKKILTVDRAGNPWTGRYIDSAHRKGIVRSYTQVHKQALSNDLKSYEASKGQFLKDAFNAPEMESKIQRLYSRSLQDLRGISADIAAKMNRVLARGVADGQHPKEIATELVNEVEISKARARTIARTEIIHAHAEGQLDGLQALGVNAVLADVEFVDSGDSRVCPLCSSLSGEVFTVDEARDVIPKHPNCRCCWQPVIRLTAGQQKRFNERKARAS